MLNDQAEVQRIFAIVKHINILLSTQQLKFTRNQGFGYKLKHISRTKIEQEKIQIKKQLWFYVIFTYLELTKPRFWMTTTKQSRVEVESSIQINHRIIDIQLGHYSRQFYDRHSQNTEERIKQD